MKLSRVLIVVIMVVMLGLTWYSQLTSVGKVNAEYSGFISQGDEQYGKELYQKAYLSYQKAFGIKKTEEAQDKMIASYESFYNEKKNDSNLYALISVCEKAINNFPKNAYYYAKTMDLLISDEQYDRAMKIYKKSQQNHISDEGIQNCFNIVSKKWYIDNVDYEDYTEPLNGYYTYKRGGVWTLANTGNHDDIKNLKFLNCISPVGEDGKALVYNLEQTMSELVSFSSGNGDTVVVEAKLNVKARDAGVLNEGKIPVSDGARYSYFSSDGKKLFGGFEKAETFSGNRAAVEDSSGYWKIIDENGKNVSEKKFSDVVLNLHGACVTDNKIIAKESGKYCVYNSDCSEVVCQLDCDGFDKITDDGVYAAKKAGKWGFITINGEWVIEPKYSEAKSFSNGYAAVKSGNEWMLIGKDETVLAKGSDNNVTLCDIGYMNSNGAVLVKVSNGETEDVDSLTYDWLIFRFFNAL